MTAYWSSPDGAATLLQGDAVELLERMPPGGFDLVFADPPYLLSNGGTTCRSGRRVGVGKGGWDRSRGLDADHEWNLRWLAAAQRVLRPNGTIWISGTSHVIYSIGFGLQQLGFRLLNEIVWEKPNPPPNLSCRCFTHATETLLWAARDRDARHHFAYERMRARAGGRQMKSVWRFPPPSKGERLHGRHPTQKPLALLERILEASCPLGGRVLDPFNGSGTTGVAAARLGLRYVGIEQQRRYLAIARKRLEAL